MSIDYVKKTATPTANKGLSTLMQSIDELQLARRPLAPHAVSQLGDEDKKLYATMLAVLLVNQTINEAQSRLLQLLLNSMKLDMPLASLYDRVAQFDKVQLQAFCALCDSHQLAPSFFMDVLVLCRLDKALSDEQVKSLAELATLLGVKDSMMKDILHLANKVLQHGDKEKYSVKAMAEAKVALEIDFDYDKLKPWHEFSYQILTNENIQGNLNDSNWLVLDKLETYKDLEINNASIIFAKNANLTMTSKKFSMNNTYLSCPTITTEVEISITLNQVNILNSIFTNYILKDLTIKNSHFFSNENVPDLPVFSIKGNVKDKVDLSHSMFKATNRAVLLMEKKANLKIAHCIFENCGNGRVNEPQGAITFDQGDYSKLNCNDTQFINEVARFAQTIYLGNYMNKATLEFTSCKFINKNKSLESWENFAELGSSLYSDYKSYNIIILESCLFTNSNIYMLSKIGHTWNWNSGTEAKYQLRNCTLENSAVVSINNEKDILINCKMKNDSDKPAFIKLES